MILKRYWRQLWRNTQGQDIIEYALMAGFVATSAAAFAPGIVTSISTIFSKITSAVTGS